MKYLSKEDITNKKVLLRCDFNVPVKDNKITDSSKIDKSLDTIKYLLDNKNTVIILSHFGRVKSEEDKAKNSLRIVYEYLKNYLDLDFIIDPTNLDQVNNFEKKCFLVENTRFTDVPVKRESKNDLELAKYWSNYADVFVIDAFASLHRVHSSTAGISKYLPTYLGFLVEKELVNLEPLVNNKEHPFLVIMGGAKVDDKLNIIEGLLKKCDKLILTGGLLNTFLKVMGYNVGKSLVSTDAEVLNNVKRLINNYTDKIYYSTKFIVNRDDTVIALEIDDIEDDDIIYDNLIELSFVMDDIKVVFLNGTSGKYEIDDYSRGTEKLLYDLKKSNAKVYVGGGDSVSSVINLGFKDSFTYLSSGGGATLEYVCDGKLDGLEYIKENA